MLIAAARVITGTHEFTPGWVSWDDGVITGVGEGEPPRRPDETLATTLVPGYVDVHSHGGGGASFSTTDDADIDTVLATHLAHGTTTMVASLVTAPLDELGAQVDALARRFEAGDLAGIHLEGPWLSLRYKGAHDPELLRDPAPAEVQSFIDRGKGAVRMVTIAPELPGAMESIRLMADAGVVAAVGHTDCDYEQCVAAVDAGAIGATHLFNAMSPLRHREPGAVGALWMDERVFVELILDGVHVRSELATFVLGTVGRRGVLVTDAMAATGQPDGEYILGALQVTVDGGVAKLKGTNTIAGSTLTLDKAVKRAVEHGMPLLDAVAAATVRPCEYMSITGVGALAEGLRADVVELDADLNVVRVARGGAWVA